MAHEGNASACEALASSFDHEAVFRSVGEHDWRATHAIGTESV